MDNATREEIARAEAGPALHSINDGGRAELIKRIEYILDPSASAKERSGRRMHLTNHDLRVILNTLHEPILDRLIAEARDKALEEAAEVARGYHNGVFAALAISALMTKDNPHD